MGGGGGDLNESRVWGGCLGLGFGIGLGKGKGKGGLHVLGWCYAGACPGVSG